MGGPLDQSRFEAPGGESWAYRHLLIPTHDRLPTAALIGPSVFAYVEDESVVVPGTGPWYYCDGTQWIPLSGIGGSGPFWYNALVDKNFAAKVAAGIYVEGQTFEAFHGWTYRVWSTVQGAIGGLITDRLNQGEDATMLVVPDDDAYKENMDLTAATLAASGRHLDIWSTNAGDGAYAQIGDSTVLSHELTLNVELRLHNIALGGPVASMFNLAVGNSVTIVFDHVRFTTLLGGCELSGSSFLECQWIQGWASMSSPLEGHDNITILGGEAWGNFNFLTNAVTCKKWKVHGLALRTNVVGFKFSDIRESYFEVHTQNTSILGAWFDVEDELIDVQIVGELGWPVLNSPLIRIGANVDGHGLRVNGTSGTSTVSNAGSRVVLVEPGGSLTACHIDISNSPNGLGNYLHDLGAPLVEGQFFDSKFTLVPHGKAMVLTTAGSDGNVLDAGLAAPGAVGILPVATAIEADRTFAVFMGGH